MGKWSLCLLRRFPPKVLLIDPILKMMKLKCLVWQLATYRMWSQLPFQLLAPCSLSYALGSDCTSQLLIALHFAHLVPSPWKVFPTPILSLYPPFCLQNSNSFPHEEIKLHPSTGGLCCPNSIGPGITDNSARSVSLQTLKSQGAEPGCTRLCLLVSSPEPWMQEVVGYGVTGVFIFLFLKFKFY